jgi:hypothetical protein
MGILIQKNIKILLLSQMKIQIIIKFRPHSHQKVVKERSKRNLKEKTLRKVQKIINQKLN